MKTNYPTAPKRERNDGGLIEPRPGTDEAQGCWR